MRGSNYFFKFFDKEEYIELFRNGKIRMMSADYYATMEHPSGLCSNRDDATEGKAFLFNNPDIDNGGIIKFPNQTIEYASGIESILLSDTSYNKDIKISCYFSINDREIPMGRFEKAIENMKDSLGEYYLFFLDFEMFQRKILNKAEKQKRDGQVKGIGMDFVRYYDVYNWRGVTGPFDKPNVLEWQKEFRIMIQTIKKPDPYIIDIGDIRDITVWGKVSDLKEGYIVKEGEVCLPNHMK